MLWVNWIPEILIITILLLSLLFLSLKIVTGKTISIATAFLSLFALFYFWHRRDGFSLEAPYLAFTLDTLSYFGRSAALLWLAIGSLFLAFHRELSQNNKIKMTVLLVFFVAFLDVLFLSKPIVMFLISWLGGLISLNYMALLESEQKGLRTALVQQSAIAMIFASFFAALMLFFKEGSEAVLFFGVVISCCFPLSALFIRSFLVKAPLSQSWWALWIYFSAGVFWIRFGLAPLSNFPEILGVVFSLTAIISAFTSLRTNHVSIWLGSALFSAVNLSLLALILDIDQGMNLFYSMGAVYILLFTFAGYAFHRAAPAIKSAKMIAALALVTFYFPLIEALIEKGFMIFAAAGMLVWLMLSASVVQLLGRLMTLRKSQDVDSILSAALPLIFVLSVTVLTVLKQPLLQLLNHHAGQ